ncbi:hypothetical protein ABW19_dt0209211 [Dactylella cylindrospora]|nr:hypothetical protein ABW19_dt0209211 [Dactylella cylindrospora]
MKYNTINLSALQRLPASVSKIPSSRSSLGKKKKIVCRTLRLCMFTREKHRGHVYGGTEPAGHICAFNLSAFVVQGESDFSTCCSHDFSFNHVFDSNSMYPIVGTTLSQ